VSKHVELWAMNVFNEWRPFCGFDTMNFLLGDEGLIKRICCHLLFYMLQKQMLTYILQPSTILYHFLKVFIIGGFFLIMCFSIFLCFYKLCVFFFWY
jgi:hypothetical protein